MIPVTKPYCPDTKKLTKLIERIHKSEWLTNFGPLHEELTEKLRVYLGVDNLLLVSNGTLALHVAYKVLGITGSAYTTPFSFIASSSSLLWERIHPRYIDINRKSLGLDTSLLPKESSDDVNGLLAVHVYGNPADFEKIDDYGKKHALKVIYDGAHAFGVKKKGKSILLAGDATTLSFHATKVFHTVEGGAIIFKEKEDIEKAKCLINFGLDEKKEIVGVGTNSKLNEYQAAVGLVLLEEIDSILDRRITLFDTYINRLKNYIELPVWDSEATLNGAYAPVILKDEKQLVEMQHILSNEGIQTRRYFYPALNKIEAFKSHDGCPVAEDIAARVLCLPLYTTMTKHEQDKVITSFLRNLRN